MIFDIPIKFTGRVVKSICADTEDEAMDIASHMAEEIDCGDLEDIDWDVKSAVAQHSDDE